MEQAEGALTPYEVYCFRCRVTFPVESRRCLHCGGPLFGAAERERASRESAEDPALPVPAGEGAGEEGAVLIARRFGGLAVWALVALSALLSHLCQRGSGG